MIMVMGELVPVAFGVSDDAARRDGVVQLDGQLLDLYRRGLAVFDGLEIHLRRYPRSPDQATAIRLRAAVADARTPFEAIVGKVWAAEPAPAVG